MQSKTVLKNVAADNLLLSVNQLLDLVCCTNNYQTRFVLAISWFYTVLKNSWSSLTFEVTEYIVFTE